MVARVGGEGGGSDYQGDSGREFWEVMAEFCSLFFGGCFTTVYICQNSELYVNKNNKDKTRSF